MSQKLTEAVRSALHGAEITGLATLTGQGEDILKGQQGFTAKELNHVATVTAEALQARVIEWMSGVIRIRYEEEHPDEPTPAEDVLAQWANDQGFRVDRVKHLREGTTGIQYLLSRQGAEVAGLEIT